MELILATRNKGKLLELKQMLADSGIEVLSLQNFPEIGEIPEDGTTFKDNAAQKAQTVAQITGRLCLADDSGLQVDYLAGAPGVYSARFAGEAHNDAANNQKLLTVLQGVADEKRTARFRCVMALTDGSERLVFFEGTCEGVILSQPRGDNGFGYDPIFYIPVLQKSMAELSMEEKNKISHRGQALKKAVQYIKADIVKKAKMR